LLISTSGPDELIYYFDETSQELLLLSNETSSITLTPVSQPGIFTILDTSDTIAISITYNLMTVIISEKDQDQLNGRLTVSEIIGVAIGSSIGFIAISLCTGFIHKCWKRRAESFERMKQDLNTHTILSSVPQ